MTIIPKDLPTVPGVYKIINKVNGKFYIGSTINLQRRMIEHLSRLKTKTSGRILQAAWRKYGADSFDVEILETCSKNDLLKREQYFINLYRPKYNISPLASGYYPSDETRKKISAGLKKRFTSAEMKDRMAWMGSLRKPEFWKAPEYREKMSRIFKEQWKRKEFRDKILSSPTKGNYKLSVDDVVEIRRLHKEEKMSNKVISDMYKVTKGTIQHITSYISWKNIE